MIDKHQNIVGNIYQLLTFEKLADAEDKVIFGGRLGEYKYYDMDAVIASVLEKCGRVFGFNCFKNSNFEFLRL